MDGDDVMYLIAFCLSVDAVLFMSLVSIALLVRFSFV